VPTEATPRVFDSLEEERAYYLAQAEAFKGRLNQQVYNLQTDTVATARRGIAWSGAYLLCFGLARTLLGTRKHVVDTPEGAIRVAEKESVLASAIKGAALLGLGVAATHAAKYYLAQRHATIHEQDPRLEQDPTEL
jgi:hypothetical protein